MATPTEEVPVVHRARTRSTDAAKQMLNRLRRSHSRAEGGALGFDIKVMRWLLAYWHYASALQPRRENERDETNPLVAATVATTAGSAEKDEDEVDDTHVAGVSTRPKPPPSADADLVLLVWLMPTPDMKVKKVLEPWEVVPVTRAQLHRLRKVPRQLWHKVLDARMIADVDARLESVRQQLLAVPTKRLLQ